MIFVAGDRIRRKNKMMKDKIENELGFSIGFDEKEKKFKLSK